MPLNLERRPSRNVHLSSAETIELLRRYPNDPRHAIRRIPLCARCGSPKALLLKEDEGRFVDAVKWAKIFWGATR